MLVKCLIGATITCIPIPSLPQLLALPAAAVESIDKLLDFVGKHSWVAVIVLALILFAPDSVAESIAIDSIREDYKGFFWIAFLVSVLLLLSSGVLTNIWRQLWRFVLCPIKKYFFPEKDSYTLLKQSRMRYMLVRVQSETQNESEFLVYQESDSNSAGQKYLTTSGRPFHFHNEYGKVFLKAGVLDGQFHLPEWGKIDWKDIFNGDLNSGCYGMRGT